jgi:hypothetical protein
MNHTNTLQTIINGSLTPYLFGFLGWQLMWLVQTHLVALDYALGISLIFLPAGIRTLAVLIFGFRGAVGVFVGAIFSTIDYLGHVPSMAMGHVVMIAAISAFSAYLMMQLVCWWQKIGSDLNELTFKDVLLIVFTQGLLSSTLHQIIYAHHPIESVYEEPSTGEAFRLWAAMAIGDITGSMILMLGGVALINALRHLKRSFL